MNLRPKRLKFLFAMLALLSLHLVFIMIRLYWFLGWLDVPMHALGTLLAVLIILSLFEIKERTRKELFFFVLMAAFFVGVLWELFELYSGITYVSSRRYIPDTLGDIVSDILGGGVAFIYLNNLFSWRKN